jgi:phenylpropionate dioxygenase-like ring-hydroxylating dioxygenase large terminal subunit
MDLDDNLAPDDYVEDALEPIMEAVASGMNRPLEQAETLPPDAYTSQAFYRLEVERIFKRDWLCIGHVSQLAKIGDYFTLDLFGEMLVVARAEDGIRAMSRICLHRWAPLVNGTGNARLFSCPFHKWGFALDGRLLGAPHMDEVEFDPKTCRLPQFPTEVVDGFIYMNFDKDAAPLAPALADFSVAMEKFKLDDLVLAGSLDYDKKINWKIVVETFMECYHHIAAHPDTFERTFPARMSYTEDGRMAWTVGHSPARPEVSDDVVSAGFPYLADLTAEERHEFRLYLIYPYHLLSLLPDRVFWFCLQPEGPARTRFQTHILVTKAAAAEPDFQEKIAAELAFLAKVNDEDIAVNEMQQLGAATPTAVAGRLSHLEKAVWQLADYVRARVGG